MMSMMRMAIVGAGVAGAAGVAVVGGQIVDGEKSDSGADSTQKEICLKGDLALFEGADARCYSRDDLRALLDRPVIDMQRQPVTLTMTHPTDASIAPASCSTCRDFREMSFDGWYAATSRDIRREGYFIRACGALAALGDAQDARDSFFANGSPTAEEVVALAGTMRIGEAATGADGVHVEKANGYIWRISADAMSLEIHELANADFDNDGVEEILAFSAGSVNGGTASFYDVGLIEKDAPDAAVSFTGLSYGRNDAAGVGG